MPPRAATAASRSIGTLRLTERIGAYAELSKFGIVLLVLVSAGAGFMMRAPLGPEFPWPQGLLASGFYNGVYTPWLKPNSPFAAVPGAIPGAIPPVIGWVAGGGHLTDAGAVILFGILFLWQMPHFWALALRYRADYAAGGFPMVSERVGVEGTARLIQLYALGLTGWALAAPTFGVGGPAALVAAAALGGRLIWLAAKFARRPDDQRGWLSLFLFSNFFLLLLFLVMVGERLIRHTLS